MLSWWDLIGNFCSVVLTFDLIDCQVIKKKIKKNYSFLARLCVLCILCINIPMIPSTKQFNINLVIYFIVVLNICDKLVSNVVSSIAFDSSELSERGERTGLRGTYKDKQVI